jgi:two-component system sensor kinase FixL
VNNRETSDPPADKGSIANDSPSSAIRLMVESLPIATIWTAGAQLRFNRAAEETCGWRGESIRTVDDWFGKAHGPDEAAARVRHKALRDARFSHCLSERIRGEDGVERSIEIAAYPIDGGEIWLLWPSNEDRAVISAIKENECRIQAVLDSTVDAIVTIDRDGKIIDVNPATLKMFGYLRDELIGQDVSIFMPSPHREDHHRYVSRYLETGEARIIGLGREVRGVRKDGSIFPVELAVSQIDHLGMFCGIMRDISERRELEQQVINAVVDERRRSAQELHDGLGSLLTAVHLRMDALAKSLPKADAGLQEEAARIAGLLKEAVGQTRAIARGLDPVGPESGDLMSSLAELAGEISRISEVQCDFHCPEPVLLKGKVLCKQLYRIAQEASTNAIKHGGGKKILISLIRRDDEVILTVADDGRGMKEDPSHGGGNGLKFMRYRAGVIGGAFSIRQASGGGTVVTCAVRPRDEAGGEAFPGIVVAS